jgi:hypothetical protein
MYDRDMVTLPYLARHARWMFHVKTWSEVAKKISRDEKSHKAESDGHEAVGSKLSVVEEADENRKKGSEQQQFASEVSKKIEESKMELVMDMQPQDTFSALQSSNWSSVEMSMNTTRNFHRENQSLYDPRAVETPRMPGNTSEGNYRKCPACIIMLKIDMSLDGSCPGDWTPDKISSIVRSGVMYGSVQKDTHIIVQFFITGLLHDEKSACITPSLLVDTPTSKDKIETSKKVGGVRTAEKNSENTRDAAVAVMIADRAGLVYCYNMPSGTCEKVSFRCMSTIMEASLQVSPSMTLGVIPYRPRSPYDDNLYAMYIACACVVESTKAATTGGHCSKSLLNSCRPSARSARATRVISNLRFLMFLCKPQCRDIVGDLLLDEINSLHAFQSSILMPM